MNTSIARDRGTACGNASRSFTIAPHRTASLHHSDIRGSQTFGVKAKCLNVCVPASYSMCLKGQLLISLGFLVSTTAAYITGQSLLLWARVNRCMF